MSLKAEEQCLLTYGVRTMRFWAYDVVCTDESWELVAAHLQAAADTANKRMRVRLVNFDKDFRRVVEQSFGNLERTGGGVPWDWNISPGAFTSSVLGMAWETVAGRRHTRICGGRDAAPRIQGVYKRDQVAKSTYGPMVWCTCGDRGASGVVPIDLVYPHFLDRVLALHGDDATVAALVKTIVESCSDQLPGDSDEWFILKDRLLELGTFAGKVLHQFQTATE